ncbi:ABC-type transport auxiliary lipoprotein family protein [Lysobacter sp. TAF61]|uniref:ABC-type transport auxiliary lipoprotein family protein n=1 Tax=Lysobacter sp. TAF61 TaxID=3233072 RepID=UPI003F98A7A2
MTTRANTAPAHAWRLGLGLAVALLLSGCSILSDKPQGTATIYAPEPHVQPDPAWPTVNWQLALTPPTGARVIDSLRIAVRPTPGEIQVYSGAQWARPPSEMLQDTLLRTFEDSGRIAAVARQGSGIAADFRLLLEIRRFESDYAGQAVPSATIEVSAKLLHTRDQKIVASRTFLQAQPATSTSVPDVARAFEQSLTTVGHDIAGWTLTSGQGYQPAPRS